MPWQYPIWTPERSFRRGFAVWDLYYTQWGNITAPNPTQFPGPADKASLFNFHGIAIGSRSTVDRVMVQTQLVADLIVNQGVVPIWSDDRRIIDFQACHIGMPLRGQVLGPVFIQPDEVYTTASEFIPDNSANTPQALVSSAFEQPGLHLQFLQRKQEITLLNGPRMPIYRQVVAAGRPVDAAEVLERIYPIAGRRAVTWQLAVTAGGPVSYRMGVIGGRQGVPEPTPLIESTLATIPAVGIGTLHGYVDLTGKAQYLTLWRQVAVAPATYHFDVTITDDCCGEAAAVQGGGV